MIEQNTITCGDCLAVLKTMPDCSAQCCVTSPPYWGLRDYGIAGQFGLEKTPEDYVQKMVAVFREVWRVLRDDGTLWMNLGDAYWSSSNRGSGGVNEWSQAKRSEGQWMTQKVETELPLKPKDLCGIPWRVAFALQADGWYLRQDIIWHKPNPMPESVTDRCTKSHEYIFLMAKSRKYYYDLEAVKEPYAEASLERYKYPTAKHAIDEAGGSFGKGIRGNPDRGKIVNQSPTGRNRRSVWTVSTKPYSEAHFATFPQKLIKPCILAGCPEGGIVLDPFMGSGTTALAARNLNRKYIGIELNQKYIKLAEKRLAQERLEI